MKLTVSTDQASGIFTIANPELLKNGNVSATIDTALLFSATPQQQSQQKPIGNSHFTLLPATSAPPAKRQLNLQVIATFSKSDYRMDVLKDFDDFLIQIEQNEGTAVTLGATLTFRRILGNMVPASFPESLYFNYGYLRTANPFRSVVDVLPGMRLRIESQVSQLVPATGSAGSSNPFANAYVSSGQSYVNVVETRTATGPLTGFDAFLASGVPPQVTVSGDGAAGGLIDLASSALRRRWFRLVYPAQFSAGDSAGSFGGAQNAVLIGADSLITLKQASDQAIAGTPVSAQGAVAVFFRGRTYIIPEILIFLNTAPVWVSLGTTLRQLFDQFGYIPHLAGFSPKLPLQRFAPGASLLDRGGDSPHPAPYARVVFESPTVASPVTDAYDLPLLGGDSYSINSGSAFSE